MTSLSAVNNCKLNVISPGIDHKMLGVIVTAVTVLCQKIHLQIFTLRFIYGGWFYYSPKHACLWYRVRTHSRTERTCKLHTRRPVLLVHCTLSIKCKNPNIQYAWILNSLTHAHSTLKGSSPTPNIQYYTLDRASPAYLYLYETHNRPQSKIPLPPSPFSFISGLHHSPLPKRFYWWQRTALKSADRLLCSLECFVALSCKPPPSFQSLKSSPDPLFSVLHPLFPFPCRRE